MLIQPQPGVARMGVGTTGLAARLGGGGSRLWWARCHGPPWLAGWLAGSTMFGKTESRSPGHLHRDTEARKREAPQPPDLWACLQVRSPALEAGPVRLSAMWPEGLGRPRLPGSLLCHLLSCLSGEEAHQREAARPNFRACSLMRGPQPGLRPQKAPGPQHSL